jgi:hypothetical protein
MLQERFDMHLEIQNKFFVYRLSLKKIKR